MTASRIPEPEELEAAIAERARQAGLRLSESALRALVLHAREVLEAAGRLGLTTVVEPSAFVERHVGESFEGAAMLAPSLEGGMLDIGSGNGFPALPIAAARPGLRAVLAEASERKAAFLRAVVDAGFPGCRVLQRQVQRAADMVDQPPFAVITARAVGGWERILPRMAGRLARGGQLLVWAGVSMEPVVRRVAWKRFQVSDRKSLPGRDRSWIWRFVVRDPKTPLE